MKNDKNKDGVHPLTKLMKHTDLLGAAAVVVFLASWGIRAALGKGGPADETAVPPPMRSRSPVVTRSSPSPLIR